jgi:hypothetical protein
MIYNSKYFGNVDFEEWTWRILDRCHSACKYMTDGIVDEPVAGEIENNFSQIEEYLKKFSASKSQDEGFQLISQCEKLMDEHWYPNHDIASECSDLIKTVENYIRSNGTLDNWEFVSFSFSQKDCKAIVEAVKKSIGWKPGEEDLDYAEQHDGLPDVLGWAKSFDESIRAVSFSYKDFQIRQAVRKLGYSEVQFPGYERLGEMVIVKSKDSKVTADDCKSPIALIEDNEPQI